MYLIINNIKYEDVWLSEDTKIHEVCYTGESLTGIESIDRIEVYSDNDYYLRTDFPAEYENVIILDGMITLTNRNEVSAEEAMRELMEVCSDDYVSLEDGFEELRDLM